MFGPHYQDFIKSFSEYLYEAGKRKRAAEVRLFMVNDKPCLPLHIVKLTDILYTSHGWTIKRKYKEAINSFRSYLVYIIMSPDDCLYIGATHKSIRTRLQWHIRGKNASRLGCFLRTHKHLWDTFRVILIKCPYEQPLYSLETPLIKMLKPVYNQRKKER